MDKIISSLADKLSQSNINIDASTLNSIIKLYWDLIFDDLISRKPVQIDNLMIMRALVSGSCSGCMQARLHIQLLPNAKAKLDKLVQEYRSRRTTVTRPRSGCRGCK